jgi:hypothetical protein
MSCDIQETGNRNILQVGGVKHAFFVSFLLGLRFLSFEIVPSSLFIGCSPLLLKTMLAIPRINLRETLDRV